MRFVMKSKNEFTVSRNVIFVFFFYIVCLVFLAILLSFLFWFTASSIFKLFLNKIFAYMSRTWMRSSNMDALIFRVQIWLYVFGFYESYNKF